VTIRHVGNCNCPHGAGRYAHGCRCDVCRKGNTAKGNEQRRVRAARLKEDPTLAPHGRASTYLNWMCRCNECITASTTAHRKSNKGKAIKGVRGTNPGLRRRKMSA
jgi:hypothetical protein